MTLTADRTRALSREDVVFLTWDHPAVRGAFELLLGGPQGNAALSLSPTQGPETALLEAVFILEAVAPGELHAARFLPPTPISILIDNRYEPVTEDLGELGDAPTSAVLGRTDLCYKYLPRMIEQAEVQAQAASTTLLAQALIRVHEELTAEIARLCDLQAVNPSIRDSEIDTLRLRLYDLRDVLAEPRLRMDSVRLIFRANRVAPPRND